MLMLTIHAAGPVSDSAMETLRDCDHAINLVLHRGVSSKPDGDQLTCLVPREVVARLLCDLEDAGVDEHNATLILDDPTTVLGDLAVRAERDAHGAPSDALVWPALRASTSMASELSTAYLALMALATILASIGLLTSSSVLIVGAMILGPEFGALAHLCVSTLGRDLRGVGASLTQLMLGFASAVLATGAFVFTADALSMIDTSALSPEFERAIVSTSWIGFITACVAGVAGVLTMTSAKGEALIGVLVSVTTIPAAADMSLGLATADGSRFLTAGETLLVNLGGIVLAGATTLVVYRTLQPARGST